MHLACLADEPVENDSLETLNRYCKRLSISSVQGYMRWMRGLGSLAAGNTVTEGAFSSSRMREAVEHWSTETPFDVVVATASSLSALSASSIAGRETPAVVDLNRRRQREARLHYSKIRPAPLSWLYGLEGRRLRRLEQALPRRAKAITLVSDAEVALYRQFCNDGTVAAIGNGVDLEYFTPGTNGDERGCVFLGALDYWPNIEGVRWFCNEIWPEVHRRLPGETLSLVGRRPGADIHRLARIPGIRLVGQVPDVRPYVRSAALSVVPLRIARGIQNKVLESMAMSKATVVSPQALEGLKARPGADIVCAGTPEEWIDSIVSLLQSSAGRRQIGESGRRFVEAHHQWEQCLQPLDALLGLRFGTIF